MGEKDIKDKLAEIPPEERAKAWEDYVRTEINTMLDIYLPEAINGNIGIKYDRPVKKVDPKTGKQIFDESKAKGVFISIYFDFPAPIEFYDEEPS